jgi:hypothetical protein
MAKYILARQTLSPEVAAQIEEDYTTQFPNLLQIFKTMDTYIHQGYYADFSRPDTYGENPIPHGLEIHEGVVRIHNYFDDVEVIVFKDDDTTLDDTLPYSTPPPKGGDSDSTGKQRTVTRKPAPKRSYTERERHSQIGPKYSDRPVGNRPVLKRPSGSGGSGGSIEEDPNTQGVGEGVDKGRFLLEKLNLKY